ncbi:phosphoribosylaminoimidazolesuccinocarboxamide synthase [Pseudodesulfovibrio senegalensis]|uniref:Phosphoribosylaminoimidazole-succinocarboxamide synthase n=1 Tax=Pseudodesulfovibrio senegalensis TaxID=1721087 RepID=A0A6N6N6C3_9BACT|nr:phosphoribosylaminoimidazolesuccinocarboxamide synthase [Pseudodesulfovibrio senegalensis]KAB1443443.1 phosphoribosylaminoimidazolesuccinocarboxamide synthase [Pseudodesulfovibrio senegalensis]
MNAVTQTDIKEYPLVSRGKVRDIYDIDEETLLIVTSDRISAYDVIMPDPIEQKGIVLNRITLFWMEMMQDLVENHIIAASVDDYPEPLKAHRAVLEGRSVLAKKAKPLPIECIVRGFITGSGWADYQKTGTVCGHDLPGDLRESDMLPEPIFTPSTKAELGDHDENITLAHAAQLVGEEMMRKVEKLSLDIYKRARDYARERGIIIADTKFEFGTIGDKLILIDEVLTPDSSRFWPTKGYTPGQSQPSFDKQFLRDWLVDIGFNKQPPGPAIPEEIGSRTRAKYMEAYSLLTGSELEF